MRGTINVVVTQVEIADAPQSRVSHVLEKVHGAVVVDVVPRQVQGSQPHSTVFGDDGLGQRPETAVAAPIARKVEARERCAVASCEYFGQRQNALVPHVTAAEIQMCELQGYPPRHGLD